MRDALIRDVGAAALGCGRISLLLVEVCVVGTLSPRDLVLNLMDPLPVDITSRLNYIGGQIRHGKEFSL